MHWGDHRMVLGDRPLVMGVINVTPDSFSDGGKFFRVAEAVAQGVRLAGEGADLIDVGGESTRPFSDPVPLEEELRRVLPVIRELARQVTVPISIDTCKAAVARQALAAGASIINDISALRMDPAMAATAAEHRVPTIVMHMQGTPRSMQKAPAYGNLLEEVKTFLGQAMDRATAAGVAPERLIVDPGIGFGKTFEHNFALIRNVSVFESLGAPLLVGPSRKAFIRNAVKPAGSRDLQPEHPLVEVGTQAVVAALAASGVHILRVHDVAGTCATLKIVAALQRTPVTAASEPMPPSSPNSAPRRRNQLQ